MKENIVNKFKVISTFKKIFMKKEKKTDLILEMEEIHEEIKNPLIKIYKDSSLICLPAKVINKEVK
jgi:hypothetical protein